MHWHRTRWKSRIVDGFGQTDLKDPAVVREEDVARHSLRETVDENPEPARSIDLGSAEFELEMHEREQG